MEAPLTGLDHRPASAMYPPTAMADSGPTFCADDAVPRMTLTSPTVPSSSLKRRRPSTAGSSYVAHHGDSRVSSGATVMAASSAANRVPSSPTAHDLRAGITRPG